MSSTPATGWPSWSSVDATVAHVALGRAAYDATIELQRSVRDARIAGRVSDVVLTAEHDPVFTLGRAGAMGDVLVPEAALQREGITLHWVERGGGITYHGPGQVTMYPILHLTEAGLDLHRYVSLLEDTVIDVAASLGVDAARRRGYPGVWVGERKLASLGIHVRHWVTMHGVAVNVAVDRRHFAMIRPCGLEIDIACLSELTGSTPPMATVEARLVERLSRRLGRDVVRRDSTWLEERLC